MEKRYKEIDRLDIFQNAVCIIKLAKQEILATMDLAEEIEKPLPPEYFSLLQRKIETGVKVIRLAFGSVTDFEIFNQKYNITDKNYKCVLVKSENYKRMLLVDSKKLLFAIDNRNERRFFYSEDPQYIRKFFRYFHGELKTTF